MSLKRITKYQSPARTLWNPTFETTIDQKPVPEEPMIYKVETKTKEKDQNNDVGRVYIVQPGDTLSSISKKLAGNANKYPQLATFNGITNPDVIQVGQKIIIPYKFDKPLKKKDIPTSNKTIVIDNYSPNYDYIVEGDKVYYSIKGRDYWVDISDNEKARKNLLNFIGDRYNFRGYENDERGIRQRVNAGTFDYKHYRDSLNNDALLSLKETEDKTKTKDYSEYSDRWTIKPWTYEERETKTPSEETSKEKTTEDSKKKKGNLFFLNPSFYFMSKVTDKIANDPDWQGLLKTYNDEGTSSVIKTVKEGLSRRFDKYFMTNEEDSVMAPPETSMEDSAYSLIPPSFTGDTIAYRKGVLPREYFIPESIDVTKYRFGTRNRGEFKDIDTEGAVITTFNAFEPYENVKPGDDKTYIGIDAGGNLKAGAGKEFGPGDRLTRSYANEVYHFAKDANGNYKFQSDAKHQNAKQNVALVVVKDPKTGELKESAPLNVLVRKDDTTGNTYGSITGGRVLVRVGNELRLLSGSLNQIESEFEAMKKRQGTDHGIFYTLDNGSFNKALRTYDRKITSSDLANYDKKNVSGGNFLYLMGKPEFKQDTVLTPNIRTEKDESYRKGHPLSNANKGVVLHYTAFSDGNDPSGVTEHFLNPKTNASAHVLILPNGNRRIFADENAVTFHAGQSTFNGVDNVNDFMHGVEFQVPGPDVPLTKEQVDSAVEYLEKYIRKYNIPIESITTHETVRNNFLQKYAGKRESRGVPTKSDLSLKQFEQIMDALKKRVYYKNYKFGGEILKRIK